VLIVAALLVATVLAVCLGSLLLLQLYGRGSVRVDVQAVPPAVAGPALQPAPAGDLETYRAEKRSKLRTYRWLDRGKGLVQIPIDEAMSIVAQRNAAGLSR